MEKNFDFIHLHNHFWGSYQDSVLKISDAIDVCKTDNQPALAITDHGCIDAWFDFYNQCIEKDIKPLLGCEMYFVENWEDYIEGRNRVRNHLILLAKDLYGIINIIKIHNEAWAKHSYQDRMGIIDFEILEKHTKGVLATTACFFGVVPHKIVYADMETAETYLKRFIDLFGKDFYLELSDHQIPEEKIANKGLIELSKKYDLKTIVTNDIHYINKNDWLIHDCLIKTRFGEKTNFELPAKDYYFKTRQEMISLGFDKNSYINTLEIAEKCNADLDEYKAFIKGKFKYDYNLSNVHLNERLNHFKNKYYFEVNEREKNIIINSSKFFIKEFVKQYNLFNNIEQIIFANQTEYNDLEQRKQRVEDIINSYGFLSREEKGFFIKRGNDLFSQMPSNFNMQKNKLLRIPEECMDILPVKTRKGYKVVSDNNFFNYILDRNIGAIHITYPYEIKIYEKLRKNLNMLSEKTLAANRIELNIFLEKIKKQNEIEYLAAIMNRNYMDSQEIEILNYIYNNFSKNYLNKYLDIRLKYKQINFLEQIIRKCYLNKCYRRVINISSFIISREESFVARYYRGRAFYKLKKYLSAYNDLKIVTALQAPWYFKSNSLSLIGWIYLLKKEYKTALVHFEESLKIYSRMENAVYGAAVCYFYLNNLETAVKYFQIYLKHYSTSSKKEKIESYLQEIKEKIKIK